jgi:hypothetical protein
LYKIFDLRIASRCAPDARHAADYVCPVEESRTIRRTGEFGVLPALHGVLRRPGLVVVFCTIVGLSSFRGGFGAASWGIGTVALAAVAGGALLRQGAVDRLGIAYGTGFLALLGFGALSLSWTSSVTLTMLEVERSLFYGMFVLALLLLSAGADELLAGAVGAGVVVVCWALVDQLLVRRQVDPFQGALLTGPIGYANGLAGLAAITAVAAAAMSVRGRHAWLWGACAQFLLTGVVLAQSRGAGLALLVGGSVAVLKSTDRPRLLLFLAFIVAGAAAVAITAHLTGVTKSSSASADVVVQSRLVFVLVAVTTLAAALCARGRRESRELPRWGAVALAAAALALVTSVVVAAATSRIGLGDRGLYWTVAVHAFADRPLLGNGPGTFERLWLANRDVLRDVRDAHSLYLEALAEQGLVGTMLLVGVLALPLLRIARAAPGRVASAAAGAYAVFLVHAGVDWDWELPAVTCAGLTAGIACVELEQRAGRALFSRANRAYLALASGLAALAAAYCLAGNWNVERARDDLDHGRPASALQRAARASSLQPWSAEPPLVSAESRLVLHDSRGARDDLIRVVSRDDTSWIAWWLLFIASDSQSQRKAAFQQAHELNPLAVARTAAAP